MSSPLLQRARRVNVRASQTARESTKATNGLKTAFLLSWSVVLLVALNTLRLQLQNENLRGVLNQLIQAPALHTSAPLFYMYHGPAFRNLTAWMVECYTQAAGRTPWTDAFLAAESMTDIWINRALLDHPRRTRDPQKASVFFIPAYLTLSYSMDSKASGGSEHRQRVEDLVASLQRSQWFQRRGGADHAMICASANCRAALTNLQAEALGRVVLGGLEPGTSEWTGWSCGDRVVAVPYAARTGIAPRLAKRPPSQRPITFFFRGRAKTESKLMASVARAFPGKADIVVSDRRKGGNNGKLDKGYVRNIVHSRFCFAPPGETPTSRRIYDAIAAGCIPVIPEGVRTQGDLPFSDDVPYKDFATFVPDATFQHEPLLLKVADQLNSLPTEMLDQMHQELMRWRSTLVVAGNHSSTGAATTFSDLKASRRLATAFLDAATRVVEAPWTCGGAPGAPESSGMSHAARRQAKLAAATIFPAVGRADEWMVDAEVRMHEEERFVLCAPPGAGAGPLEAAVAGALDVVEGSPLPLKDQKAMALVYSAQWNQVRVVRDPVVRLVALFLERVATDSEESQQQQQQQQRQQQQRKHEEVAPLRVNAALAASFKLFVAQLAELAAAGTLDRHATYRPQRAFCGARYRPFSAVVPRETLRRDGGAALRALGLWEGSGWEGSQAAGSGSGSGGYPLEEFGAEVDASVAAVDRDAADELFAGCSWAVLVDDGVLDSVETIYGEDYRATPWYNVSAWRERLEPCQRHRVSALAERFRMWFGL